MDNPFLRCFQASDPGHGLPTLFLHFPHVDDHDELLASGRRRPEGAQLSARKPTASLRTERHEAGDQFGIDPVRLGQSTPAFTTDLLPVLQIRKKFAPAPAQSCNTRDPSRGSGTLVFKDFSQQPQTIFSKAKALPKNRLTVRQPLIQHDGVAGCRIETRVGELDCNSF